MATKLPSKKQVLQRKLAWKLKCVTGAKGNIYPRELCFSERTHMLLLSVYYQLETVEEFLRDDLRNIK